MTRPTSSDPASTPGRGACGTTATRFSTHRRRRGRCGRARAPAAPAPPSRSSARALSARSGRRPACGQAIRAVEGMRQAIRLGLSTSVSGLPVWGSDVGGYLGKVSDLAADPAGAPTSEDILPTAGTPRALGAARRRVTDHGAGRASTPAAVLGELRGAGRRCDTRRGRPPLRAVPASLLARAAGRPHRGPDPAPARLRRPGRQGGLGERPRVPRRAEPSRGPNRDIAAETTDTQAGRSLARVYLSAGRWIDLFTGDSHDGPATFVRETRRWPSSRSTCARARRSPSTPASPAGLPAAVAACRSCATGGVPAGSTRRGQTRPAPRPRTRACSALVAPGHGQRSNWRGRRVRRRSSSWASSRVPSGSTGGGRLA